MTVKEQRMRLLTRGRRWAAALLLATTALVVVSPPPANALDNGVARTPPMGWNSWNTFGCNITRR